MEVNLNEQKKQLSVFTLLVVGLISSLTLNLSAQSEVSAESNQLQKTKIRGKILQNYIDISSVPINKRRKAFSDLSSEDKANAFKLHLALQFVKRPNLTTDQKDIILEGISAVTPDTYDRTKDRKNTESVKQTLETRATSIFSRQEAFEIFSSLGGDRTDVEYLQKYLGLANFRKLSERKEFFRNASSQDKSQYWKVHFARSLVLFPDLTKQQKDIILDAIALANPRIFEISKTSSEWKTRVDKPIKALSSRTVEAFSKEEGIETFLMLGDGEFEPEAADCDCSKGSIAGCWSEECTTSNGCKSSSTGCGLFWDYPCNGKC